MFCRSGKKILFIASTVPLVHQQGAYLKNHTAAAGTTAPDGSQTKNRSRVKTITGETLPENWSSEKWNAELNKYEVCIV
jgi:ERCC4-related helicase